MISNILINAVDPEECRIAKVVENKLEEFHIERASKEITRGNIYKAVIARIEPSLQAVFVDYGAERHGFLQKHEIHSDYFQDNYAGDSSISNIVKKGQEFIVQVVKDPLMKKGAMLTTFISLPGRFVVCMPGSNQRGISRKIDNEDERNRLKRIISEINIPEGFGLIVRTAGINCTKTKLSKDFSYLFRLWKKIKGQIMKENAPALLFKERNLALRSIRDYFTPDINEILIDNISVYHEVKDFIKIISSKHTKIVKLYKGEKPIFTKYQLEDQIASIYKNRVNLKSGGSIVIEQTEALVAIDVNSGKANKKKSIEETALQTNIEAAEEIARQLRLRDLGGLIVLDCIDMKGQKHKTELEGTLKNHLKRDKAKTKVGKISKFGLIEMSRQRIRPSIGYGGFETCKYCHGKGMTPSPETLALAFLRKLSIETLKKESTKIMGIVPVEVADYLLNNKRKEIVDLELRRNLSISIKSDSSLLLGDSKIINSN